MPAPKAKLQVNGSNPGATTVAFLEAMVDGVSQALFDQIGAIATGLEPAGNWSAASGAFPAGSDKGSYYVVSAAGAVDGEAFAVGDWLVPLKDNASATKYAGNWFRADYSKVVPRNFKTVTDFLASLAPSRGVGSIWEAEGHQYEEIPAGTASHLIHRSNAAGVLFKVLPDAEGRQVSDAWGVPYDGSDAQPILQKFHDYAASAGQPWVYSPRTYVVSDTVQVTSSGDGSAATIRADGNQSIDVWYVGKGAITSSDQLRRLYVSTPYVENSTYSQGGGFSGVRARGIVLKNLYESTVNVRDAFGFASGFQMIGRGTGCVYNTINIQRLTNNKVNHHLFATNEGWVNENNFFGGRNWWYSAEGSGMADAHYVLHETDNATVNGPNNNRYFGMCLEGNGPLYQISINGGNNNIFVGCRYESAPFRVLLNDTAFNAFQYGYGVEDIEFTNLTPDATDGTTSESSRYMVKDQILLGNRASQGAAGAYLIGYNPAAGGSNMAPLYEGRDSDRWTWKAFAQGQYYKRHDDAEPRLWINGDLGRVYFGSGSAAPGSLPFFANQSGSIACSSTFRPLVDAASDLGTSSGRWGTVYAATGTISTSDARSKMDIEEISDAERRVAIAVKKLVRKYRFRDAVAEKGEAARIHFGAVAQDVIAAFEAEGLDPMAYGMVCYDEWESTPEEVDEDGNVVSPGIEAGDRYSLRYDELLAFIISAA